MIRIDDNEAEQLRWYINGWYEGDMGKRSLSSGRWVRRAGPEFLRREDATGRVSYASATEGELEYDTARTGGPPVARDPSARMLAAARRLRIVEQRWSLCTPDQKLLLDRAFRVGDCRGLMVYGAFPRAALGCRTTYALFKERGGSDLAHLEGWLRDTAEAAAKGKRGRRRQAQADVEAIRAATEAALTEALVAFGVAVAGVELPRSVSLRQLARSVAIDDHTAKAEIVRRQVKRIAHRNGYRISVADLLQKWPEAAERLGNGVAPPIGSIDAHAAHLASTRSTT